jgi:hypothetical protein
MEKTRRYFTGLVFVVIIATISLQAQDAVANSKFTAGADLYSNYIWRGTKFGQGPAIQPSVKYINGGLTVGVWGSFDAGGYAETDPYINYAFKSGLSFGLTDYYYPGLPLYETSDTAGSHALEINGGFTKGVFTLGANYIVNEAGGAGSKGGDMYFQAGLTFSSFNMFVGAGDGWHTSDGEFALCNVGLGTSKVIKLTDSFSIPVTGQVIMNPEREQLYVVVGFTF